MRKVWHDRDYRLQLGEHVWHIDVAHWASDHPERDELRVYAVRGDVNHPLLDRALFRLAKHRGLYIISKGPSC